MSWVKKQHSLPLLTPHLDLLHSPLSPFAAGVSSAQNASTRSGPLTKPCPCRASSPCLLTVRYFSPRTAFFFSKLICFTALLPKSSKPELQRCTQVMGRRPFGVGLLIVGSDATGPHVYQVSLDRLAFEQPLNFFLPIKTLCCPLKPCSAHTFPSYPNPS